MADGKLEEDFCYSSAITHGKTFHWRIDNFSLHAHRGSKTSSKVFKSSSGSEWSLTLCLEVDSIDENYVDFITVYLDNCKSYRKQFVKVKLSICDRFGNPAVSNCAEVLFDTWDTTSQKVFSISKDYVMKELHGLNRMLLVPNDVLTLRCDMTITEENQAETCESKDVFKSKDINDMSKDSPFVLWCTKALIFLHPALIRGKEVLCFTEEILKLLWMFVVWPAIVFLAPVVYRILRVLIISLLILCYDFIVWGIKECVTSKGKHKSVKSYHSPYEQPKYINGNMNKQPKYFMVSEMDVRRLCNFLNSQKYSNGGPPALVGEENFKKWPKLTYHDNYNSKTGQNYF